MATKKKTDSDSLKVEMDTSFVTNQRGMFTSGIVAEIGGQAYTVLSAIKVHADFETGECWPGIRRLMEMTGTGSDQIQKSIKVLEAAHLLRVKRLGSRNIYVPRERLDVRIGSRLICTVVIDYVPVSMRERLAKLKEAAASGDMRDKDVWADVELVPGPGMVQDPVTGLFSSQMRADDVALPSVTVTAMREHIKQKTNEMREKLLKN